MLAMSFIAMLLLGIAMLTIQISNIYTKGITLKEVNQAGLTISNDLQRSINASIPFDISESGDALVSDQIGHTGGRLCVGQYSYAWNYGTAIDDVTQIDHLFNTYDGARHNTEAIRFIKVVDPGKELCQRKPGGGLPNIPDDSAKVTEMLAAGERDLVLHSFQIQSAKPYPLLANQRLYTISFQIGTNDQQAIDREYNCKPPNESQGYEDYCAINRFDITARAGNQEE